MSNWGDYGDGGGEETLFQATPEPGAGQSKLLARSTYPLGGRFARYENPYLGGALDLVIGTANAQEPPGYYEGAQSIPPAMPFNMETEARALEQFNTPPNSSPAPSPARPPPGVVNRYSRGSSAGGLVGETPRAKYQPEPAAWPPPGAASRDADQREPGAGGAPGAKPDGGQHGAPPAGGGGGYAGLPPIQVPYFPWESEAELHADYAARRDGLKDMLKVDLGGVTRTVTGPEGPFGPKYKDYQKALQALDKEEAAVTEQFNDFQETLDGQSLSLGRYQMGMQSDQTELQARELETGAGVHTDRAKAAKDAERKLERQAQKAAARRERVNAAIAGEMAAFKDAIKTVENTKIDPYGKRSTGEQIGFLISMALASVGNAAIAATSVGAGGKAPTGGFGAVEARINQEMQAQIQQLENKKAGLGARQSLIGMMRAQLGDLDQAEAAAKAHIYEKLELKFRALEDYGQSAIMKNRALGARMWAAGKRQEFEMVARLQATAKAEELERQRMLALAYAASARQQQQDVLAEEQALMQGGMLWSLKDADENGYEFVDGVGLVRKMSDPERQAFNQQLLAGKETEVLLQRMMEKGKLSWANYQLKKQMLAEVRNQLRAAGNSKFFDSEKEGEALESMVPDPNMPWNAAEALLGNMLEGVRRKRTNKIASYGAQPAERVLIHERGKDGRPVNNPYGGYKRRVMLRVQPVGAGQRMGQQFDYQAVPISDVDPSKYQEPPAAPISGGGYGEGVGAGGTYLGGAERAPGFKVYR